MLPRVGAVDDDDGTTRSSSGAERSGELLAGPSVLVFVIAWYPEQPDRVGELAIVPAEGSRVLLGRGAPDSEPRMRFFRPRPGRLDPAPPLAARGLSRRQAELQPGRGRVVVRRVGRCAMRINGVECDEGSVTAGDTIAFRQELVLLCSYRPACAAPLRHFQSAEGKRFGAVDSLGIIGESPATWLLRDELAFAAQSERHVLIVGESGTGKELAARAIHHLSARADRHLVARNAATLPASLMDAEMFGNSKNYPNPGMGDRSGLIGQADGGFLFLDEIGDLPANLQSHLLRVLDSGGEYQRLGESVSRHSSFRLLAATNRDPTELRPELLARLTVKVELPPLRERREDIPLLVRHLVVKAATETPALAKRFTETSADGSVLAKVDAKLIDALLRRDYLGNVRELEAILWKAISASDRDFVPYHEAARADEIRERDVSQPPPPGIEDRSRNPEPSEEEIRAALINAAGNVARAAEELGLSSRYALYRRLVKLGIDPTQRDQTA
jgi:two-component system nitrogen regulation response regulator GlnG/two-component system response regulator HydG